MTVEGCCPSLPCSQIWQVAKICNIDVTARCGWRLIVDFSYFNNLSRYCFALHRLLGISVASPPGVPPSPPGWICRERIAWSLSAVQFPSLCSHRVSGKTQIKMGVWRSLPFGKCSWALKSIWAVIKRSWHVCQALCPGSRGSLVG
jgi:hypothetical protein